MHRDGTDPKQGAAPTVPLRASQAELAPTAHMPVVQPPEEIAARPTVYGQVAPPPIQTPPPMLHTAVLPDPRASVPVMPPVMPMMPTTFQQPMQSAYVGPIPAMRTGMGPMQPAAIVPRARTESGRGGWIAFLIVVVLGAAAGVFAATRLLAHRDHVSASKT
ncbi:MAG: hypothetical protein QM831_39140 [Kofleriaceae bacterium]